MEIKCPECSTRNLSGSKYCKECGTLISSSERVSFSHTKTIINIAKQICRGLTEAHQTGVVHRDLKSSNIMIDIMGEAKIMDFGLARSLKENGITGTGVMLGTADYMSPEQAEGKEADQRSDIYSLGVILYEMVTGRLPFKGETALSIALKHKSETPQAPRRFDPQIPDELNRLILKCMSKNREERYQSAKEIFAVLERIEHTISSTERDVQLKSLIPFKKVAEIQSRKKVVIPVFLSIAFIIIVFIFWHPWSEKEALSIRSDKPSLAILHFKNSSGDLRLDNWTSIHRRYIC